VYNKIVVWGQSLEPSYSTDVCTYNSETNTYNATITFKDSYTLTNFDTYSILLPQTNKADSKLNINGTILYVTDDKGKHIPALTFANTYNVFKYRKANNDFYWLGEYQVYAEAEEININSPFHKSKIGTKINGIEIYHIDQFRGMSAECNVAIGIITVPAECAQGIADLMVAWGIKAIWNFTPARIKVPTYIAVQNTTIYTNLAILFNKLHGQE
jgi:hypothetical protein